MNTQEVPKDNEGKVCKNCGGGGQIDIGYDKPLIVNCIACETKKKKR